MKTPVPQWLAQGLVTLFVVAASLTAYDRLVLRPALVIGVVDMAEVYRAKEAEFTQTLTNSNTEEDRQKALFMARAFAQRLPLALDELPRECNCLVILLTRVISRLRPDLIHSMEMQAAGYLTLEAKKQSAGLFPPRLLTLWGSDVFLFGRLADHKEKIRAVLENCDYFSCECEREVELSRALGLKGEVVSSGMPVTGGFCPAEHGNIGKRFPYGRPQGNYSERLSTLGRTRVVRAARLGALCRLAVRA